MAGYSTEFKVGLFVMSGLVLMVGGYLWSYDGVRADEPQYHVRLKVKSADGLFAGTPVKLAGVPIGAVSRIDLEGDRAVLTLTMRKRYELPTDTVGELKSSGLLGDRFVQVLPGTEPSTLQEGGVMEYGQQPGDFDIITKQVEDITGDVSEITKVLRRLAENDENSQHVESSLANVDALTDTVRLIAQENRRDIDAITDSIRRLSESLEGYVDETGKDVDEELEKLKDATDTLQRSLDDVESITGKVDSGQGTIGALINERETIDAINDTIEEVNTVVKGFSGLRAEVYWHHRYFVGSQPDDPAFFYGNPMAYTGSNILGVRLRPSEDFMWFFEINDYPQGVINQTESLNPQTGEWEQTWTRDAKVRISFMMERRFYDLSLRLGVKHGGGGLGATYHLANDRLKAELDVFDFYFGSYPQLEASGLPNVRFTMAWEPREHIRFHGGLEQIALGARYGYATGFLGGGFHFDDDDIKLLLAILPLNP